MSCSSALRNSTARFQLPSQCVLHLQTRRFKHSPHWDAVHPCFLAVYSCVTKGRIGKPGDTLAVHMRKGSERGSPPKHMLHYRMYSLSALFRDQGHPAGVHGAAAVRRRAAVRDGAARVRRHHLRRHVRRRVRPPRCDSLQYNDSHPLDISRDVPCGSHS